MSAQQLTQPVISMISKFGRFWVNSPQKWSLLVRHSSRATLRPSLINRKLCHSIAISQETKNEVVVKSDDEGKSSQTDARIAALGKCVAERMLVENILVYVPTIEVTDIIGLVDAMIYMKSRELKDSGSLLEFLTKLGSRHTDGTDTESLSATISETFNNYLTDAKMPMLLKLAHPKYILMDIIAKTDPTVHIKTAVVKKKSHGIVVGLYVDENLVAEAEGDSFVSAERDACRDYLLSHYKDQVENTDLAAKEELCLEEEIHLRDSPYQRKVELVKEEGDNYGFYIRGGEQEELSNVKYRKFYYYTPPYINKIDAGSSAQKSGKLHVGDVILAVDDFTTKGMSHQRLVKLIQSRKTTLNLTVVLNPDVRLIDYLRQKEKERGMKKMKADVSAEKWREWHLAQAEKDPLKYLKFIKELESSKSQS